MSQIIARTTAYATGVDDFNRVAQFAGCSPTTFANWYTIRREAFMAVCLRYVEREIKGEQLVGAERWRGEVLLRLASGGRYRLAEDFDRVMHLIFDRAKVLRAGEGFVEVQVPGRPSVMLGRAAK